MNKAVNDYISQRYNRWLDYSEYHCSKAGIPDEAIDVLNEVLLSLLKKNESWLVKMIETDSKCGNYKELDLYVLRMIRLNIVSPTSPYQSRYRKMSFTEINSRHLRIADSVEEQFDRSEMILERFHVIDKIVASLQLSSKAKRVFKHRFINDLPFSQWKGPESKQEVYETYKRVIEAIKEAIKGTSLM